VETHFTVQVSRHRKDTSTDPIWVIIHSNTDGGYWAVKCDDNLQAKMRAGKENSSSDGHWYKLRAIVPTEELVPGVRMTDWPKAKSYSRIICIYRLKNS
jgi:hypothetical protein